MLVALALGAASCGGGSDGEKPSANQSATTGPTGVTQAPTEKRDAKSGSGETADTGGATQPSGDTANESAPSEDKASTDSGTGDPGDKSRKKRSSSRKGTATTIEELSPAERKALHEDLYKQGKNLCSAYKPSELAEQYNIQATTAADVAREYAELYEAGNPSLVLPYQQGCLAGFKQRERKSRNAADETGA